MRSTPRKVSQAFTLIGAFDLDPASLDVALVIPLALGNYTLRAIGAGESRGTVVVEAYECPD
jgi:hypothetical protein